MFVWYRAQQISHHHDVNAFFNENGTFDAKIIIPTNPEQSCNHIMS